MRKLIDLIFRGILFFAVCFLFSISNKLHAEELPIQYDSSTISIRKFDSKAMEDYKSDSDFDYATQHENQMANTYEFNWLARLLKKLFGISFNNATMEIWEYIVYIVCGAIVLFALFHLVKADKNWFFKKSSDKSITYEAIEENIHEMDIDELIRQAVQQKQFRRAVRLLYLKSLKELNNKNLIYWSAEKTNHDYLNELKAGQLKESFKNNTLIFEYIWYGDFQINEQILEKVKASFDHFNHEIKGK